MIALLADNAWLIAKVLIAFTALIFIHEMGHYLVARWCGVRVETFSIGFGPELAGWGGRSGTRWRIAWLPLGGYVKFADPASDRANNPGADSANTAADTIKDDDPALFRNRPLWQRASVVAAGPVANFLLAIAIFALLFATLGQPHAPAQIARVIDGSPAATAGLQPGDLIVGANGESIDGFGDIQRIVAINLDRELALKVRRDGVILDLSLRPDVVETDDGFGRTSRIGRIGVVAAIEREYRRLGPVAAVVEAVERVWETATATLRAVGDMILGARSVSELRGPAGIAHLAGEVAQVGIVSLLSFAAFISISLGLINLFPIPMLDGGHLLFYAVEAVRGRPLGERAQEVGYRIGLGLVVTLMVVATFNDVDQFGLIDLVGRMFH